MSFSYSDSVCFCCVHLSLLCLCLSVSSFSFLSSSFCSASGRIQTFNSTRVLISGTCRQSRLGHRHRELHFTCIPCSHSHCTVVPTACVSSPMDWAVSRGSHKQNDDMANYRMGSCTEEPSGLSEETARHSAPASLPLPFRIAPFVAPFSRWCSNCVPTVSSLCAVSLLLPRMLMVLLIFQMITVHASDSGSNAKMLCISATTLYAVWTSASCSLMFLTLKTTPP